MLSSAAHVQSERCHSREGGAVKSRGPTAAAAADGRRLSGMMVNSSSSSFLQHGGPWVGVCETFNAIGVHERLVGMLAGTSASRFHFINETRIEIIMKLKARA